MMPLSASPLRVLVVDDEPAILRFVRTGLTGQGYHVSIAETGRGAIEELRKGATDLIVLDLGLPDIDGLDVIAHVRGEARPCRSSCCPAAPRNAPR